MSTDLTKNGDRGTSSPAKLSHAVLRTTRLKEMVDWYKTVLNAEVLFDSPMMAFMTYDEEHHRIAIAAFPGVIEKPKHSAGLDHLAFFYSAMGDWIANYERLKAIGITPKVCIHHGLTMSLYYRDPDDNGVELSIDNVEKSDWHNWMRNSLGQNPIGAPLDPDDIARKFHAGASETELRRFSPPPAGMDPEFMRRMLE
jgi:catechol-2,3-dioxygenase